MDQEKLIIECEAVIQKLLNEEEKKHKVGNK